MKPLCFKEFSLLLDKNRDKINITPSISKEIYNSLYFNTLLYRVIIKAYYLNGLYYKVYIKSPDGIGKEGLK